jgi:hypothetical protein
MLRMSGVVPLLPVYFFMALAGKNLTLYIHLRIYGTSETPL